MNRLLRQVLRVACAKNPPALEDQSPPEIPRRVVRRLPFRANARHESYHPNLEMQRTVVCKGTCFYDMLTCIYITSHNQYRSPA